jgi:hypothetical protein
MGESRSPWLDQRVLNACSRGLGSLRSVLTTILEPTGIAGLLSSYPMTSPARMTGIDRDRSGRTAGWTQHSARPHAPVIPVVIPVGTSAPWAFYGAPDICAPFHHRPRTCPVHPHTHTHHLGHLYMPCTATRRHCSGPCISVNLCMYGTVLQPLDGEVFRTLSVPSTYSRHHHQSTAYQAGSFLLRPSRSVPCSHVWSVKIATMMQCPEKATSRWRKDGEATNQNGIPPFPPTWPFRPLTKADGGNVIGPGGPKKGVAAPTGLFRWCGGEKSTHEIARQVDRMRMGHGNDATWMNRDVL